MAVVTGLLEQGANPDTCHNNGQAVLQQVCRGCSETHEHIAVLLVKHGAKVNQLDQYGYTPVYRACEHGWPKLLRALLDKDVDADAPVGALNRTPLHVACEYGHRGIVHMLLAAGVSLQRRDGNGHNVLELMQANPSRPNPIAREIEAALLHEQLMRETFDAYHQRIQRQGRDAWCQLQTPVLRQYYRIIFFLLSSTSALFGPQINSVDPLNAAFRQPETSRTVTSISIPLVLHIPLTIGSMIGSAFGFWKIYNIFNEDRNRRRRGAAYASLAKLNTSPEHAVNIASAVAYALTYHKQQGLRPRVNIDEGYFRSFIRRCTGTDNELDQTNSEAIKHVLKIVKDITEAGILDRCDGSDTDGIVAAVLDSLEVPQPPVPYEPVGHIDNLLSSMRDIYRLWEVEERVTRLERRVDFHDERFRRQRGHIGCSFGCFSFTLFAPCMLGEPSNASGERVQHQSVLTTG